MMSNSCITPKWTLHMALEENLGFPHTPVPGDSIIWHQGFLLQYFFPVLHGNQGSAKLIEPTHGNISLPVAFTSDFHPKILTLEKLLAEKVNLSSGLFTTPNRNVFLDKCLKWPFSSILTFDFALTFVWIFQFNLENLVISQDHIVDLVTFYE